MRPKLCLAGILLISRLALANPCDGIDDQLKALSLALGHEDAETATRLYTSVAHSHADCTATLLAQARLSALRGDAGEADGLFENYLAAEPDNPAGNAYYARFLISQRQYSRADALASAAFDKAPSSPIALAVSGQLSYMKGQAQQGFDRLTEALRLDPEDAESHFQLGSIYDRLKRPVEAVPIFQKTVEINPRDARAWDYLALNLEPLGELERAESAYKKGLEVDQHGPFYDAFLDYNYGRFLMKRGDLTTGKTHLDRAVELVPQVRAVWYERAKLNLRLKNYQEARSDGEKAANLADPAGIIIDLQIYTLLEQIYRRLGETDLANKYAELSRTTPPPVRKQDR
jgi:tetratricopeptide (TPR) repeat protein